MPTTFNQDTLCAIYRAAVSPDNPNLEELDRILTDIFRPDTEHTRRHYDNLRQAVEVDNRLENCMAAYRNACRREARLIEQLADLRNQLRKYEEDDIK